MTEIRIANIDSKYINYLRHFDDKVMYNKGQKRPYIGILFVVKQHYYYAPLSHPKEKFKQMKNEVDFMKIQGGELGAINFNNMIPVNLSAAHIIDIKNVKDEKYKMLLINQMRFFDKHDTTIIDKATKLYRSYKNKTLRPNVYNRCCNFILLEKKSKNYNPNYKT